VASLVDYLRKAPGVGEVTVAGSYRRSQETVGDINIVATVAKGPLVEPPHRVLMQINVRKPRGGTIFPDLTGSQRMKTDLKLQQRVMDALEFDPSVDAAHVGVSARDGVVTLSGHVASFAEKFAAERVVRQVKGVHAVAQELEVRLPSDKKVADDEIAARAVRILKWDQVVPGDRIAVKVEHGIVTLSGEVDWHFQRTEAEYDIRKLGGVRSVINQIVVAAKVRPEDVHEKIQAALERNAEIEAGRITVAVSGGKVTLGGKVNAWTEREAVERAAWSAPGVTEVEDRIELARP
jgi:osmotically-inducible protein OsmY